MAQDPTPSMSMRLDRLSNNKFDGFGHGHRNSNNNSKNQQSNNKDSFHGSNPSYTPHTPLTTLDELVCASHGTGSASASGIGNGSGSGFGTDSFVSHAQFSDYFGDTQNLTEISFEELCKMSSRVLIDAFFKEELLCKVTLDFRNDLEGRVWKGDESIKDVFNTIYIDLTQAFKDTYNREGPNAEEKPKIAQICQAMDGVLKELPRQ